MTKQMKYGKDFHEHTHATAKKQLETEGFVLLKQHTQQFTHRMLYHYQHPTTTQRASISVEIAKDVAVVSYSMLKSQYAKRRTSAEKRRDNYVQFD